MNIRSLFLGSVAAAGLSTGAYAADLGVLTSLDVCDALGLSGLTISSDTNCLQINGEIKYDFRWGDYRGGYRVIGTMARVNDPRQLGNLPVIAPGTITFPPGQENASFNTIDNDSVVGIDANGTPFTADQDWESRVDAFIRFVATADSDFGPAKAVLKIKQTLQKRTRNEGFTENAIDGSDNNTFPVFDEAYVSIGDSTVIMAGKKGSILNKGDDTPFNFLGLFNSEGVDTGVDWLKVSRADIANGGPQTDTSTIPDGGAVIQVVSDLGNGVSVGVGLEKLEGSNFQGTGPGAVTGPGAAGGTGNPLLFGRAGTAVGVINYAGDNLTAHISGAASGILDGNIDVYGAHAGFTGKFDNFRVTAAGAFSYDTEFNATYWNVLASAEATFDIFKIAISGEATSGNPFDGVDDTEVGFGGSIGADVVDGVSINLGGRYFDTNVNTANNEGYQVAAQLVAAVTETIAITGEVGVYGETTGNTTNFYGAAQLAWAPGGGFTSSIKGEAFQQGGYRATFKAAKTFN